MAAQLEVIRFRDLLAVTDITRFIEGLDDPTLEVKGEDFSSVETVLINELPAPEFIVVNNSTMWVQLPVGALSSIRNIQVISGGFTKTAESSVIQFRIGDKTRKIEGVLKLTQLVAKWLLQTPGSDIFNPRRGGGLQEIAGKVLSSTRMEPVQAALAQSVDTTATQIRSAQAGLTNLPLNERLLSATIIDMKVFDREMRANLRVRVKNMTGDNAISSVDL
jgi:hypothetical protein